MWRHQSTIGALVVCLATCSAILLLCLLLALLTPISVATPDDLATLNTLAQVAGGAFGTLVTVVVFAIGLVSQRSDGTAMYTPFVARRYHVFVIAAFAAAVCLMNAVGPLVGEHLGMITARALLLSNLITMPLVVLATVWLMCRVIEAAGGTDLISTLPVFRAAMRRIAAEDHLLAATSEQFLSALDHAPLTFNQFAGHALGETPADSCYLGSVVERLIVDADLRVLQQIIDLARPYEGTVKFSILTTPGHIGDRRGVLHLAIGPAAHSSHLTSNRDERGDLGEATAPASLDAVIGAKHLAQLRLLADRLFRYGERPETDSDLRQFFARAQADLERLALSGDSITFKARMGDYRQLVEQWLVAAGPTASMPRRRLFASTNSRFLGPLEIDLAAILRASVRSRDFLTYEVAVDGVSHLLCDTDDHKGVALYREVSGLLAFAFYLAMQEPDFRAPARELFDRRMESLLMARHSLRDPYDHAGTTARESEDNDECEMRHAIVGSLLRMIRYAIEVGEAVTARMLIDRLTRRTSLEHQRVHVGEKAPSKDDGESLIRYALIVVLGWCHHMIQEKHAQHATAHAVMEYAVDALPARHALIGLWELYNDGTRPRAALDNRLQLDRWDLRDAERRVGFVTTRSGGSEWIADGFWIAMLRSKNPHDRELRAFFQAPPGRWLWKAEGLDERLKRLQFAIPHTTSPEDQQVARSAVIELIRQRQRAGDAFSLRAIVQTPLSAERQEQFRKDIVDGVVKHRLLSGLFPSGFETMPVAQLPMRVQVPFDVHRDYLLGINSWGGEYGNLLAERTVQLEVRDLVCLLEQSLPPADISFSLERAGDAVRTAVRALAKGGYAADMLILPPQTLYACAVFCRQLWGPEIGRRADRGPAWIGVWEGLRILQFSYSSTSSIIVADSRAVFGRAGPATDQSVVEMTDVSEEKKQACLAQITDDVTQSLPGLDDLRVTTHVSLRPTIGIADLRGACRLEVGGVDHCFVMDPYDKLYHRVTCPEIQGSRHLMFSSTERLNGETGDRTPCTVCKPERQDEQVKTDADQKA